MALIWMTGTRRGSHACHPTINAMLTITAMFVTTIRMTRGRCVSVTSGIAKNTVLGIHTCVLVTTVRMTGGGCFSETC